MTLFNKVCFIAVAFGTLADPLLAARVDVQETLALMAKVMFVCPDVCQECCDDSFITNGFKCILSSPYPAGANNSKKREYTNIMKAAVETNGYSCNTPSRRWKSLFQFKTRCSYKDNQEKPAGKCSKETYCCCNEKEDEPKPMCINPLEHKWYKYSMNSSSKSKHDPSLTIEAQEVIKMVDTQDIESSRVHIMFDNDEYRPAQRGAQDAQEFLQISGECNPPVVPKGYYISNYPKAPIYTEEGCCLETEEKRFYVFKEPEKKLPKCKTWQVQRHCPFGQIYVEFVGQRKGVCFGDQSTGASLSRRYGGEPKDWAADAENGRIAVKSWKGNRGRTLQKCPTGWFHDSREGLRSCTCAEGCGGVGME